MTATDLTPNAELAYRVLDHIDAHPDSWNQGDWWCGTTGCFAGWAVTLSGCKIDPASGQVEHGPPDLLGRSVSGAALKLLRTPPYTDVFDEECEDLFDGDNDREDLGRIVADLFGPRPQPTGGDL